MTWQDDIVTVREALPNPDWAHAALARLESRLEQADKLADAARGLVGLSHADCNPATDDDPFGCEYQPLSAALADWFQEEQP